jgi:hypothetical protein
VSALIQELAFSDDEQRLLRQARLLLLLEAAGDAGLEPVPLLLLHALAYLSNALAPVWSLQPFDGKVLKRRGSPFYPVLQWDVDHLVGRGLIKAFDIRYIDDDGKWRINASYTLNPALANNTLDVMKRIGFSPGLRAFCAELAQAMAALPPDRMATVISEDAAYGDPMIEVSNVVNFAEDRAVNFTANAAEAFRPDVSLTPSERVHLYIRHLQERVFRHAG